MSRSITFPWTLQKSRSVSLVGAALLGLAASCGGETGPVGSLAAACSGQPQNACTQPCQQQKEQAMVACAQLTGQERQSCKQAARQAARACRQKCQQICKGCKQGCQQQKQVAVKSCNQVHAAEQQQCQQVAQQTGQACNQAGESCREQCQQQKQQASSACNALKGKERQSCQQGANQAAQSCQQGCQSTKQQCQQEKQQTSTDCKQKSSVKHQQCHEAARQAAKSCKQGCCATVPEILRLYPADGAVVMELMPAIYGEYADPSGKPAAAVHLFLDGQEVTAQAELSLSTLSYTPATALSAGPHVLRLEVVSQSGLSASAESEFMVDPDPALVILNRFDALETAVESEAYSLQLQAQAREQGAALSFSLLAAPAGMAIDAASGLISWTPAPGQGGEHEVSVQVSDGQNLVERSFTLRVASLTVEASALVPAAQGGRVEVTDPDSAIFGAVIDIPAGALGADTEITLSSVENGPPPASWGRAAGPMVHVGPAGTQFAEPARLTLPHQDGLSVGPDALLVATEWSGGFAASSNSSASAKMQWAVGGFYNLLFQAVDVFVVNTGTVMYAVLLDGVGAFDTGAVAANYGFAEGHFVIVYRRDVGWPPAYSQVGTQEKKLVSVKYTQNPGVPLAVIDLAHGLEYSYKWYQEEGYLPKGAGTPIIVQGWSSDRDARASAQAPKTILLDVARFPVHKDVLETAAHELFHIAQGPSGNIAYGINLEYRWLAESSATFMQERVFGYGGYKPLVDPFFTLRSLNYPVSGEPRTRNYQGVVLFFYFDQFHKNLLKQIYGAESTVDWSLAYDNDGAFKIVDYRIAGGLRQAYLDFVHRYTYTYSGFPEISDWSLAGHLQKQTLMDQMAEAPLKLAVWPFAPGQDIPHMAGGTAAVELKSRGGFDFDEEWMGQSVVVKFNKMSPNVLGRLCAGEAACQDVVSPASGTKIRLGPVLKTGYKEIALTLVNGSFAGDSGTYDVDMYIECFTQIRGLLKCQDVGLVTRGVSGATVELAEGEATDQVFNKLAAQSGDNGEFSFSTGQDVFFDCKRTSFNYEVTYAGKTQAVTGGVQIGKSTEAELVIGLTSTVFGKVVDQDNKPVAGAEITLELHYATGTPFEVAGGTTNSQGAFGPVAVNACGVTEIVATAEKDGSKASSSGKAPDASGVTDLGVIELAAVTTTVEGTVTVNGEAKAGVGVTVTLPDGPGYSWLKQTDGDGKFSFEGVPANQGNITVTVTYEGQSKTAGPTPPVLGGITEMGVIELASATTVQGKVTVNGAPEAGVAVTVSCADPTEFDPITNTFTYFTASGTTGGDGGFSIGGVPANKGYITVKATRDGASNTAGPTTPVLGGITEMGSIELTCFTTVQGKVTVNGVAKAGVGVKVTLANDPGFTASGTTGGDGSFSIGGVPANKGYITVESTHNGKSKTAGPAAPVAGGVTNVGTINHVVQATVVSDQKIEYYICHQNLSVTCPDGTTISEIIQGTYAAQDGAGGSCSFKASASSCLGKPSCSFGCTDHLCGDPCFGHVGLCTLQVKCQ